MKKFIPIFIFLLTIVNGQDRFAKKGKTVSAQKDGVEKISSTSNQPVPRRISYQGLITKADGSPTDDGSYEILFKVCLLYTSPSPRDSCASRMPSSA